MNTQNYTNPYAAAAAKKAADPQQLNSSQLIDKVKAAQNVIIEGEGHLNLVAKKENGFIMKHPVWNVIIDIIIGFIILAIFDTSTDNNMAIEVIACILWIGSTVGLICLYFLVLRKNAKKYIQEQNDIIQDLVDSNRETLNFLPSEYWFSDATSYMIHMLESGRCDTYRQMLNMTDDHLHKMKVQGQMATMQSKIDESNRKLRQIEHNTFWSRWF